MLVNVNYISSGWWSSHGNVYQDHFLMKEAKTWDEARAHCRKNLTDLAVIGSHDDTEAEKHNSSCWVD